MGLLVKKYQTGNKADFDPYAGLYSTRSEEASSTNQVPQNIRNLQEEQAKKAQVIADAKEAKEKKARRAKEIEEEIRIRRENPDMVKGISDVEAEKLSERSDRLENPTIGDRLEQLGKAPARYITNPLKILGDIDNAVHGNTQLPSTIKERNTDIKSKLYNTPEEKKKLDALKKEELTDISINAAIEAGTLGAGKLGSLLYKQGKKVARAKNISKIANASDNAPKPTLDWGKWNKEIPQDKALMKEYGAIEAAAKKDGTWMKNADDTPFKGSNPTKEELAQHGVDMTPEEAIKSQFVEQRSKAFKEMMGDTDLVYRGDKTRLSAFKSQEDLGRDYVKQKYNLTEDSQSHLVDKIWDKQKDRLNTGIYSTSDKSMALGDYAKNDGYLSALYTRMKNPKRTATGESFSVKKQAKENLLSDGYDSMITPPSVNYKGENVVFNPSQLKSAIGNNGKWSQSNNNIYKAIAAPVGFTGLVASILNNKE